MLTLTEQTATSVGDNWDDEDDARWRGAARKYLATVASRTYLVKPDIGWPSDRDSERTGAAYYRALRQPVPNVVNATIGGIDACAVRILPNARPIGDGFDALSHTEALDVFRGLLLSSLIGDRDRHQYNWIADGERAYAIDHGLAFAPGSYIRISSFATDYVYTMMGYGIIDAGDMLRVIDDLPDNVASIARMAWSHVQRNGPAIPDDVRPLFRRYVESIIADRAGESALTYTDWYDGWTVDSPDDDPEDALACDCPDCIGEVTEASDMTWHRTHPADPGRWTRRHPHTSTRMGRNKLRCGFGEPKYAPRPHAHRWTAMRGWHSTAHESFIRIYCVCRLCERPAGRQFGKPCASGAVFPRKVDDILRNRYVIH